MDRFYSSLLNLPKPFFDTRKIGELVARLNDTQRVQRVISQIVGNVVINALVTIVSLGFSILLFLANRLNSLQLVYLFILSSFIVLTNAS